MDALKITILIPVYDDWPSLHLLIEEIHAHLKDAGLSYEILIVDDASPTETPTILTKHPLPPDCRGLTLLRLRKNLGHQRAIAVGLVDIHNYDKTDVIIVMDGDGEDSAAHMRPLVEACALNGFSKTVFARRTRRMEGVIFKLGYEPYCLLHRIAVGDVPRVGNFSAVPYKFLPALVIDPNLWNHFAATVLASRLPYATVSTPRGKRYLGKSKLNFNALVVHGISALACYNETIGVRAVISSALLLGLTFCGVLIVSGIRLFTPLAIPGWATVATGFLMSLSLQLLTLGFAFCLLILSRRQNVGFIPLNDVGVYVLERRAL